MPSKRIYITFTLRTAATLSYVALRLGTTKSQLVEGFLAEPLEQLRALLFAYPDPLDRLTEADKAALYSRLGEILAASASAATTASVSLADARHG